MVHNIRPPLGCQSSESMSDHSIPTRHENGTVVTEQPKTWTTALTPTKEQLEQAAARVSEVLRRTMSHVEISIDPDLQKAVMKIVNGASGEVLRQIPSPELIELAKHLDSPTGLFVRRRA